MNRYLAKYFTGAVIQHVSGEELGRFLPPQQQAIVARVDSLMAVIDELENQISERREQAQMLMQTVLSEAFYQGVVNAK